ncbi:potassium/proton antiporter membrane subunit, CPA2 family [Blastococcus aggregatus]|uniref:Potassium/proton antiporter membrane subunit, CPA2 family n=1 Tax=Blastococcus aggregatus TaxID=38502 RepID=A0A285VI26_9ACTN|nr:cation:proton antiporter [Blastococcus aggregatus]SOC53653.1 potassium/proton antiporter membrane subunit, CPA2 family [Blastococcus aggregatus]
MLNVDAALAAAASKESSGVLLQLGLVLFGLGLLGLLAHRLKVSPVPLYLLAGLAFGEHGPVPLTVGESGREFIAVGAELGAVLLLLMLGLEYAADELLAGLRHTAPAGVMDLALNAAPGAALALLLGWGPVAAVALAGVTYVSSSGIVAKLLSDLGHLGNRETPTVIAVLVFEDLTMAGFLPVLTALVSGLSVFAATMSVSVALAAVVVVFIVAIRLPGTLARLVFSPNDEVLLLRVLGLTLLVGGLAGLANVSATVGAFLVGVALSGPIARSTAELLRPLRDLFAAVFFVFFGLQIQPTRLIDVLPVAVALAVITAGTKVATGWWAASRAGVGRGGRLRAGVALIPRGEFSIVIAGLTTAAAASTDAFRLDPSFGALVACYVLLLAVLGPVALRLLEVRRLRPDRRTAGFSASTGRG